MKDVFSLLVILIPLFTTAQTGPAGIGTTDGTSVLELWFDGQDVNGDGTNPVGTVTTWADKSGNARNVTENIANVAAYSNPGVTFNNTGYLTGSDVGLPTGNASRTVFVMASSPSTPNDDLLFFYGNSSSNNSFGVLKRNNGGVRFFFFGNDLDDAGGWIPYGDTHIATSTYISGTPGSRSIHVDGVQTAAGTPSATPNTTTGTQGLQIGGWNSFNLFSNATISEVLFYATDLNQAQRIIVENYLAAKYNIALVGNDVFNEDDPGGGDYDFEVAGIGQASDGSNHTNAQGTGILGIQNPTGLDNDEFLIWGHDNQALTSNNTTDVPSATVTSRLSRTWRVSEANSAGTAVDVGSVDLQFDLSGVGAVNVADLSLLIDTNNDGSFSDETPIFGALDLGGGIYGFSGVTGIEDNLRFTVGTERIANTVPTLSQWGIIILMLSLLNLAVIGLSKSKPSLAFQK